MRNSATATKVSTLYSQTFKEVLMDNDNVSGYDVPVDPMDLLQCDSCQ